MIKTAVRIKSIDVFRALTMLLMIFVNDLWTLTDIPGWLEHKRANEDGMGLADVVFPAFLFIVGLSIPYAIKARINKGESNVKILTHILERSVALLVMGLFMVNLENVNSSALWINEYVWEILMALAFILIWNNYQGKVFGKIPENILKLIGLAILIFLAIIYRGRPENNYEWMRIHWWGILGLIGWGYMMSAIIYLLLRDRPVWIAFACLVFYLLNINEFVSPFHYSMRIFVSASNYASVMSGLLVATILIKLQEKERMNYLVPLLMTIAVILLFFGFITRPEWGISKIRATPSWTSICAGISTISFVILYILTDKLDIYRWANIISPAGKSTLTCYLVPYIVYPLFALTNFHLPAVMVTGIVGLLKSLLFALIIIWITGGLNRLKINLKI
jgi:heparan-alpha-glucosaminide N-acetyltransferase